MVSSFRLVCVVLIRSVPAFCDSHFRPDPAGHRGPECETFHLTARPWQPLRIAPSSYLGVIEGLCRFTVRHQNSDGPVIDPFLHREHQYATPYFAYAVGTLISAGRAQDLLSNGIEAMEHSTHLFAGGRDRIPEQHGEFFIPPLTAALEL